MPAFDHAGARQYALHRLDTELSRKLFYHSAAHTRYDVVRATELLARHEGVKGNDLLLLVTAAYFHDVGFIHLKEETRAAYQQLNHELLSVQLASRALPEYGFSASAIETINTIIMATRLPQAPHTILEQIMADADLDSIGREDFWATSANLRIELAAFETHYSDYDWYQFQAHFLSGHSYFTAAAHKLRDERKAQNLREIARRIEIHERAARYSELKR